MKYGFGKHKSKRPFLISTLTDLGKQKLLTPLKTKKAFCRNILAKFLRFITP